MAAKPVAVPAAAAATAKSGRAAAGASIKALLPGNGLKKHAAELFGGVTELTGGGGILSKHEYEDKFLIDRRHSRFMPFWDGMMVLALFFAASVTPFEVTYISEGNCITPLFIVNRIVDALFILDIVLTFNLIDQDPHTGRWLYTRRKIARQYFRSWFTVDVLSVLPLWILTFILSPAASDGIATCANASSVVVVGEIDSSGTLSIIRCLRLVRLIKLARILKASRVIKNFQALLIAELQFPRATVKLVELVCLLFLVVHWQACLWSLSSYYLAEPPREGVAPSTWIAAYIQSERAEYDRDVYPIDVHVAALYWSFMTLTSIGYGDFYPLNTLERALSCLYQLVSGIMWAYVIGTMAKIAASIDPDAAAFDATMEQLTRFMAEHHLPRSLRDKLRGFFDNAKRVHRHADYDELILGMTPLLKGEVALATHGRWLRAIPCLRIIFTASESDQRFLGLLTMRMAIAAFIQKEWLPGGRLYIVRKGLVTRMYRMLSRGRSWGEDILLEDERSAPSALVDRTPAVAVTFVEMWCLRRSDFEELGDAFPAQYETVVRHLKSHLKLQRAIIRGASLRTGTVIRSYTPIDAVNSLVALVPPSIRSSQELQASRVAMTLLEKLDEYQRPPSLPPLGLPTPTMATAVAAASAPQAAPQAVVAAAAVEREQLAVGAKLDAISEALSALSRAVGSQQAQIDRMNERLMRIQPAEPPRHPQPPQVLLQTPLVLTKGAGPSSAAVGTVRL